MTDQQQFCKARMITEDTHYSNTQQEANRYLNSMLWKITAVLTHTKSAQKYLYYAVDAADSVLLSTQRAFQNTQFNLTRTATVSSIGMFT